MPEAASGDRDSPLRRSSNLHSASAQEVLVAHLARQTWRLELELEIERRFARERDAELHDIQASTSWRVTRPLRMVAPIRAWSRSHLRRAVKALHWTLTLQLRQQLRRRRAALADAERERLDASRRTFAEWFTRYEALDDADVRAMRDLRRQLHANPLVSVVMPVYDPPESVLREAMESVLAQEYENWELCVADDASTQPHVRPLLEAFECRDERIRVVRRTENGGISAASNDALSIARGEILVLLDHDDLLRPHSLLLAVRAFDNDPGVGLVYSDLVVVDESRTPVGHYFKPDWNPALLLSQNFLCHLSAMRMELVREAGGFRSEFDGSQDWDLGLRVTERLPPSGIVHIPHVLYLWRAVSGSVAADVDAKPYAVDAGRRAVEDHLRRIGATGYSVPVAAHQSVRLLPSSRPKVDVLVPSTGRPSLLRPCVQGVLTKTSYSELQLLVRIAEDDAFSSAAVRRVLEEVASDPRGRVSTYPSRPFNFSRIVNEGFASTDAPFVLLLNDDTEVIDPDWLEYMVGYALQERVGAVGSLLLYPDGSIQSAGMLVGARGAAEHLYHRRGPEVFGYSNRARLPQDLTVVAGTSMLVCREAFEEVGGWDESFPAAYNDVDFCLKLRERGWRVVYVPDAAVVHHASATFGQHQRGREAEHRADLARLQERWGPRLRDDPMHNPNLELDASYPDRLAFPPRTTYAWRASPADVLASAPGTEFS